MLIKQLFKINRFKQVSRELDLIRQELVDYIYGHRKNAFSLAYTILTNQKFITCKELQPLIMQADEKELPMKIKSACDTIIGYTDALRGRYIKAVFFYKP